MFDPVRLFMAALGLIVLLGAASHAQPASLQSQKPDIKADLIVGGVLGDFFNNLLGFKPPEELASNCRRRNQIADSQLTFGCLRRDFQAFGTLGASADSAPQRRGPTRVRGE